METMYVTIYSQGMTSENASAVHIYCHLLLLSTQCAGSVCCVCMSHQWCGVCFSLSTKFLCCSCSL